MDCAVIVNDKRRKCGDGRDRPFQEQGPLQNRFLNTTWHVPSRCFVDAGFQTLDPFGVLEDRENASSGSCTAPQT